MDAEVDRTRDSRKASLRRVTDDDVSALGTLVSVCARTLVRDPDSVTVSAEKSSHRLVIVLETSPDDTGRVIGHRGVTVQALRDLLYAGASVRGIRAELSYKNDRNKRD